MRLLRTAVASLPLVYFIAFFAMIFSGPASFDFILPIHSAMIVISLLVVGGTFVHGLLRLPSGQKTGWLLGLGFMGQIVAPVYWWSEPWRDYRSELPADRCPTCHRQLPAHF